MMTYVTTSTISVDGRSLLVVGLQQYLKERASRNGLKCTSPSRQKETAKRGSFCTPSWKYSLSQRDGDDELGEKIELVPPSSSAKNVANSTHFILETSRFIPADQERSGSSSPGEHLQGSQSDSSWSSRHLTESTGERYGRNPFRKHEASERHKSGDPFDPPPRPEMDRHGFDAKRNETYAIYVEEDKTVRELGDPEGFVDLDANVHVENGNKTFRVHKSDLKENKTYPYVVPDILSSLFYNERQTITVSESNKETELVDRKDDAEIVMLDSESGHVLFQTLDETLSSSFQYHEGFKEVSEIRENDVNVIVDGIPDVRSSYTSSPKTLSTVKLGMNEVDSELNIPYHIYARIGESKVTEDAACGCEEFADSFCSSPICECKSRSPIYEEIPAKSHASLSEERASQYFYAESVRKLDCQENTGQYHSNAERYLRPKSDMRLEMEQFKDILTATSNAATFLCDVSCTSHGFLSASSRSEDKDNSPAQDNDTTYLCDAYDAFGEFCSTDSDPRNNAAALEHGFLSASVRSEDKERCKDNSPSQDNDTTYLCDAYDAFGEFCSTDSDPRSHATAPEQTRRVVPDYCAILRPPSTFSSCDCLQDEEGCSCSFSCHAQEGSPDRSNTSTTIYSPRAGLPIESPFACEFLGHTYCELEGPETSSTCNLIEPSYVRIGERVGVVNPYCVVDVPIYAEAELPGGLSSVLMAAADTYSTASTLLAAVQMCPADRTRSSSRCNAFVQAVVGIPYVAILLSLLIIVLYALYRIVSALC